MKTLIAYYSFSGNNETLAKELQKRIDCDIFKIEAVSRRSWLSIWLDLIFDRMPAIRFTPFSLAEYDRVICIAPIWASKIAAPLKTFLNSEKDKIKEYSFITVCGGASGQVEKIEKQLTDIVGKKPYSIAELWISSLPQGKKETIKFKVNQSDLDAFENQIQDFMKSQSTYSKA